MRVNQYINKSYCNQLGIHTNDTEIIFTRKWFDPLSLMIIIPFFLLSLTAMLNYKVCLTQNVTFELLYYFIIPILFPIITYILLALIVNRSKIKVCKEQSTLDVIHGPIPWIGNKKISIDDIRRINIKESTTDKFFFLEFHSVFIEYKDKSEKKLVGGIFAYHQAQVIAKELNIFLTILEEEYL